jgi:hypothetical protein
MLSGIASIVTEPLAASTVTGKPVSAADVVVAADVVTAAVVVVSAGWVVVVPATLPQAAAARRVRISVILLI